MEKKGDIQEDAVTGEQVAGTAIPASSRSTSPVEGPKRNACNFIFSYKNCKTLVLFTQSYRDHVIAIQKTPAN